MLLTVLSVIGAALITLGAVLATREHAWLQKAKVGRGSVVELVLKHAVKAKPVHTPRIRYTAQDGSIHDFVSTDRSRPASFSVGENVRVAYDPQTFESRILTFGQRFGAAAVFCIVGLSLILIKVTFTYGDRLMPRIYAAQISEGAAGAR
jgi:hypothetical protein